MPIFAVYKSSTGEITQLRTTPNSSVIVDSSEAYIEVDDTISDATYKIDLSTLTAELKTAMTIASTLTTPVNSTLSITGIPLDTTVAVFNEVEELGVTEVIEFIELEVDDGTLDFTADLAGDYTLVFTSPLYLETTTVITVTD